MAERRGQEDETETTNAAGANAKLFRNLYKGNIISAGGYTPLSAKAVVAEGICDCVGFGRWFISNPDLPQRLMDEYPLNRYERSLFYTYDEGGYTDYPDMRGTFGVEGKYGLMEQADIGSSLATSDAKAAAATAKAKL